MGKRSPILGYNHNVRYRGLVFHVQTEDSGVSTPHLFTHLFHHGVIVSTRKLVYDAGSAEESIRSLMQAQHKAVLKDLRRGHFDDKIDAYLGGTPGLLPRGAEEPAGRASEIELAPPQGAVEEPAIGAPTEQVLPMAFDEVSAPVLIVEKPPAATPPPLRAVALPPIPPRASGDRPSAIISARPTANLDTTLRTEAPSFAAPADLDLAPEIEIQLELDDQDDAIWVTRRTARDTETQLSIPAEAATAVEDGKRTSGIVHEDARRAATISDGVPGAIRPSSPALPPPPADSRRLGDRPSTINAATLPPARPIVRPAQRPTLTPPQIVSRPLTPDDRGRREPELVEVYAPAPPSAEHPPGERPGQYAQHHVPPRKVSARPPVDGIKQERSGGVPIPAGLGPPRRMATSPTTAKPSAGLPMTGSAPTAIPREASTRTSGHTEPLRTRAPTPSRIAPTNRVGSAAGSGVVMTRPAVIVGAPAKNTGTIPRIRKAREEEGRGFGQGLISEKSLDEVILAYLSEDADEK